MRLRRDLAAGYAQALADARTERRDEWSARVPVEREQVLAAAPDIERLIGLLSDTTRVLPAEEVLQAHALLCDGGGPMFTRVEPGTLRRRIRMLCEAMG
jgi:hypothetical protein